MDPTCECGCGQPIPQAWRHRPPYFVVGHIERIPCGCGCGVVIEWPHDTHGARPKRVRGHRTPRWREAQEAKRKYPRPERDGICLCGCGERTPLAKHNHSSAGVFKGQPTRYIAGHQGRGVKHGPGRYVNRPGYVLLRLPDHPDAQKGYVLEHRLVAELTIGRPLVAGEVVHHINGERADNRPENLVVLQRHEHAHHHLSQPRPYPNPEHRTKLAAEMKRVWAERKAARN